MIRHKWKDNTCTVCGITRVRRGWKLRMAIVGNKDYYKYGTGWFYGMPHKEAPTVVKGIGFKRPECINALPK